MKILHVTYSLGESQGGPSHGLATLSRAQADFGETVTVLPATHHGDPLTIEPGEHGRLTVLNAPTRTRLYWYDGKLRRRLREVARGHDIVHLHGSWRYHVLGAAAAARAYGIPYIVRPYGNLGAAHMQHKALVKRTYLELIERPLYRRAAAIHCCSIKERDEMEPLRLGARRFIVPQPVESDLLSLTPDQEALRQICPTLGDEDRLLTFLGRISFIKQLDLLLEAFLLLHDAFPQWRLVLAGPHEFPDVVGKLQRRIQSAGVHDKVSMPGMVRGRAKAALLRRTDLFAQPSRHENFGVSIAEAFLFGLPCVVGHGVALAPEVQASGAGLVWSTDVPALAECLRTLMADDDKREAYGRAAATLAHSYRPEAVAALLHHEYEVCLTASA